MEKDKSVYYKASDTLQCNRNIATRLLKKKVILLISISLSMFILFNCTGKEVFDQDNRIPDSPTLIPHLGDTGDSIYVEVRGIRIRLDDTNNGIDTVPDNDWIRVQWNRIDDPALDYLKLYRFGEYAPEPTLVDSLSRSQVQLNEYLDNTLHIQNPIGQKWSYYTELFLTNGNYSVSDTVSYKLTQKPFLLAPDNYAQLQPDSLYFHWERTEDALHYRVLVFSPEHEYIWHEDYYIIEDSNYTLPYSGPDLTPYIGDVIIWRVDSFGDIENEEGISISGAESRERYVELIAN